MAKNKIIKVGLKANSQFLFGLTNGKNLGGYGSNLFHSSTILLNNAQFEDFKMVIEKFGYSVERSLAVDTMGGCDYSCSVSK